MSDLAKFRDLLEKARWPLVCAGVAVLLHMRLMLIAVALPVLVYWHSQTQPDPNEEEQAEEGPYDEEPVEDEDEDFAAGPPRGMGGPGGARPGMGGGKLGNSSASPNDMDFDSSFGLDLNDPLGLDDTPSGPPAKPKASSSSVLSSLGLDDEPCHPSTGKPKSGGGGSFLGGSLFGGSNSKANGGSGGLDFLNSSLDMDDNDDLLGGFGGMDGGGGFGGRGGGKGKGGKMGGGKGGGKDGKGGKGEGFSRDPDPKQVFVAGVGDWPEDQIRSFFEDVGEVTRVKVLTHADGQPKGVCFVTFATEALAQAALRLDGAEIHDKRLIVRQAHGSKGDNKGGGGKGGLGRSGDSFPSRDLGSRMPFGDGERRGGFGDGGRGGFGDGDRRGGFGDGERRGGFGDGERRGGFGDGERRGGGFGDRDGPGRFSHDGDRMGGGFQMRRERSGERGQKERDKPSSEIETLLQEALDEEDGPLKLEDFDQGSKRFLTELMLKDRINGTRRSVEALEMVFKQCRQKQRDSVRKWRAYTFTLLQKFDPELSDEIAQKRLLERDAERKQQGSKGGPARDGKRDKDTDAPGQSDIKRAWDFAPAESEGRQVLDRWGKPVLL